MSRIILLIVCLTGAQICGVWSQIPSEEIKINLQTESSKTLLCPINKGADKGADVDFAQWYTTGKSEEGGQAEEIIYEDGRYTFPGLASLLIENMSSQDEGWYYCKIAFSDTKEKKFHIAIEKEAEPQWLRIPVPQNQTLDAGQMVVLPCRATDKDIRVQAFRLRSDGSIMKELRDQGVVIHKLSVADEGTYMCVAKNSAGRLEYKFSIKLKQPRGWASWDEWSKCDKECGYGYKIRTRKCNEPTASTTRRRSCPGRSAEHISCRERLCSAPHLTKFGFELTNEHLILSCAAKGIPKPTAEWIVNGVAVASQYRHDNGSVIIPNSNTQSGSYSCKLKNSAGYFTMSININV